MKIKFIEQEYQTNAVNSAVDIFKGTELKESIFTVDLSKSSDYKPNMLEDFEYGYANKISLTPSEILSNVREVQQRNKIKKESNLQSNNFTIEMETGTGKTYVYIKTILELNRKYGLTKFIIVVPSIAIKEGVNKSFEITEEHFKTKYNNLIYNYFVYESSKLNRIQQFATSNNIEIMIINIDAFRKSFQDDKESKANLIHRVSDKLGNKPIDLISGTNPIVIIDEPQSVDNTPKAKEAIKSLKPLAIFRYSATHKEVYNLLYKLTPVDAYQQKLVKRIEVSSVKSDNHSAAPYVRLLSTNDKNGYSAKIEMFVKDKLGSPQTKTKTLYMEDDLYDVSNELDYYNSLGLIVQNINTSKGNEELVFNNGQTLKIGEAIGVVDEETIKRAQIRETIDMHLEKESSYIKNGIKVLSLFFIDKVLNYREYSDLGYGKGKYALWFEEEYEKAINGKYKYLKDMYPNLNWNSSDIHEGYFSKDKKNKMKDTKGDSSEDDSTYNLIMRDKERLLSFKEPIRFLFSHSALKEGWDNPNVCQVCTLIESKDTFTKRQKLGRGLRLVVNQDGERITDSRFNRLTVIANESYKDFAATLQKEFNDAGYKFGVIDSIVFTGLSITNYTGEDVELSQEQSTIIYNFLKDKGYFGKNNKATEEFYKAVHTETLNLPDEFLAYKEQIINTILEQSKEIEIHNRYEKVEVKLNKQVITSPLFNEMWNRIKQKTIYSVNLPLEEMINLAIKYVKDMPEIVSEKIIRSRMQLTIEHKGVMEDGIARTGKIGDISDYINTSYPDFIRRLQDSTSLLRSTIIKIVKDSNRLEDFYKNPEIFIKYVTTAIIRAKKEKLVDGIQYTKLENDYYLQEEIFNDENLTGYLNKNVISISNEKNVFDHVIFDSMIEKMFALEAEADEDVKLYAKLPTKFEVNTPFGPYWPDWMVVIQSNTEEKLYFVAETKGSNDSFELREKEKAKILCGRKHFEVIDNDVKFKVIKELSDLKV